MLLAVGNCLLKIISNEKLAQTFNSNQLRKEFIEDLIFA